MPPDINGDSLLQVSTVRHDFATPLVSAFSLRNACMIFYTASHYNKPTCHASQFLSREGVVGIVYGYSEHRYGFHRLMSVRPAKAKELPILKERCPSRGLGVGAYFSSNNLFHQWFHAVPAFETLMKHVAQDPGATFVPLVGGNAGNWTHELPKVPYTSHAWEFTLRALTANSGEQIAANLKDMLGAGKSTNSCALSSTKALELPCVCFDRFEASVGGFSPYSWSAPGRFVKFREAALSNARRWRQAPEWWRDGSERQSASSAELLPMLYVARASKRSVVNEQEIKHALQGTQPRLRFVALEAYSLADQMWMITESVALIGVHGQAFAWLPFLPFERRRTAAIEIVPYAREIANKEFMEMYSKLGRLLEVNYTRVFATPIVGDGCDKKKRILKCNVTLKVSDIMRAVQRAARWTRQ
jgi:hypothetical protein